MKKSLLLIALLWFAAASHAEALLDLVAHATPAQITAQYPSITLKKTPLRPADRSRHRYQMEGSPIGGVVHLIFIDSTPQLRQALDNATAQLRSAAEADKAGIRHDIDKPKVLIRRKPEDALGLKEIWWYPSKPVPVQRLTERYGKPGLSSVGDNFKRYLAWKNGVIAFLDDSGSYANTLAVPPSPGQAPR